jgi:hypothetical protein
MHPTHPHPHPRPRVPVAARLSFLTYLDTARTVPHRIESRAEQNLSAVYFYPRAQPGLAQIQILILIQIQTPAAHAHARQTCCDAGGSV